jgi:diguanylate cyclase (GGDEF)-like protein/PAS domain S-box-containing protein
MMPKRTAPPFAPSATSRELARLRRRLAALERAAAAGERTARNQQEAAAQYRLLFDAAREGLVLIDATSGRILRVNRAFAEMAGAPARSLTGRVFWEIGPLQATDAGLVTVRELQRRDHIFYDELPFLKPDRTQTAIELSCTAHRAGSRRTILCAFRDVSGRKAVADELWRSQARFRALFRHANIGIAFIDTAGRIVENNRALEVILGYEENALRGADFAAATHPEDRAVEAPLFQELAAGRRGSYHLTARHLRRDGTLVWGLLGVSVVRDPGREAPLIIRTLEDITDRKRAEEAIIRSRDFYRSLLDELPNPIRLADGDGNCDYINRAWRSFTGRRLEHELGSGWTSSIHPDDRDRVLALIDDATARRTAFTTEYRLRRGSGEHRWIVEFSTPFNDGTGSVAGRISSCYDIHERRSLEETLRSISITDDLTGLLNRRGFFALAQQQLKIANRSRRGLMLVYADLDGLKRINDVHGHAAGDRALTAAAGILRELFRESDIIARLGGDEFSVLLTEDRGGGDEQSIRERLLDAVRAWNSGTQEPFDLSVSVGAVRYDPDQPGSLDRLLTQADELMYRDKKGKAKV